MQKSNAFVDQRFGGRPSHHSCSSHFMCALTLSTSSAALMKPWHACQSTMSLSAFRTLGAEEDASLTAEDRAIARFQKQRLKELKGVPWTELSES